MADYNRMVEKFRRALATGESFHTEISIQRRDSRRVWIAVSTKALKPDNLSEGLIVIAEDVTEKRTDRERINFLAYHDMLTGLPNRMLMADRLQQALATAARNKRRVAVFFIDLDHFKEVNDTLGHEVGDQLIKQVGEKIKNCVRESDTVARFGGDEFLITLPDIMLLSDVEVVAKKVLAELNEPFRLAESTISTSSSIGISLYPDHGENIETLMKHADIAMYRAKQKGGNTYCFYHNGDEQAVSEGVLRDAY